MKPHYDWIGVGHETVDTSSSRELLPKMIFAITTRVREIVRVLRGLPLDDSVRQRTSAINAQLAKVWSGPLQCRGITGLESMFSFRVLTAEA